MIIDPKISPENIILDWGNFEDWENGASSAPTGFTLGGGGSVARESTEVAHGTYSAKVTYSGSNTYLYRDCEGLVEFYQGRKFTLGFKAKTSVASKVRIQIDDGVGTSNSSYHTGGGDWEYLTVTRDIDASATRLRVIVIIEGSGTAYFDGGILCEGDVTFQSLNEESAVVAFDFKKAYEFDVNESRVIRRRGNKVTDHLLTGQDLFLRATVKGTSVDTLEANLGALKKVMLEGRKDFYFHDERMVKVYLEKFDERKADGASLAEITARLKLDDLPFARYFNMERVTQSISSSPTTFTVTNNGTAETYPVITFVAGGTDITSISFENLTNGEVFSYSGTVSAGNELVIDTDAQTVLNNNTDDIENWGNGDWLKLVTGDNIMKFTGSNCTIKVDFYKRYL